MAAVSASRGAQLSQGGLISDLRAAASSIHETALSAADLSIVIISILRRQYVDVTSKKGCGISRRAVIPHFSHIALIQSQDGHLGPSPA